MHDMSIYFSIEKLMITRSFRSGLSFTHKKPDGPHESSKSKSFINAFELIGKIDNAPNPFSNRTTIHFTLEAAANVTLDVYNLKGEKIRSLIANTEYQKGEHSVIWNSQNEHGSLVESGVYFYRIKINDEVVSGKMILKN